MTSKALIAASLFALNSVLLISCKGTAAQNSDKPPVLKITSITAPKDFVKGEPETISKDGSEITGAYVSKDMEKLGFQPPWFRFKWSTTTGFIRIAGRGSKEHQSHRPAGWKEPSIKGVPGLNNEVYAVDASSDGKVALFENIGSLPNGPRTEDSSYLWVKGKGWLDLAKAVKQIPEYASAEWSFNGPAFMSVDGKRLVFKYANFRGANNRDAKGRKASGIAIIYAPNGWEGFPGFVKGEE